VAGGECDRVAPKAGVASLDANSGPQYSGGPASILGVPERGFDLASVVPFALPTVASGKVRTASRGMAVGSGRGCHHRAAGLHSAAATRTGLPVDDDLMGLARVSISDRPPDHAGRVHSWVRRKGGAVGPGRELGRVVRLRSRAPKTLAAQEVGGRTAGIVGEHSREVAQAQHQRLQRNST
jgi:hypothetical protein